MNLAKASKQAQIKREILLQYQENGLLNGVKTSDGSWDYSEKELRRVCFFYALQKAGMDLNTLKQYNALLQKREDTSAERIRILRKCRYRLLDEIHGKQQALDRLDYLIYEMKNKKKE